MPVVQPGWFNTCTAYLGYHSLNRDTEKCLVSTSTSQLNHRLLIFVGVWNGNLPGKSWGKCLGCQMKAPTLLKVVVGSRNTTFLAPSPSRKLLWKHTGPPPAPLLSQPCPPMPPRISEQANGDYRVNWFNLLIRVLTISKFVRVYVNITLLFARPPLIGSPRSFTNHVTAAFISLWKLMFSSFIWQVCSMWRIEVFYGCDWSKPRDNDNQVNFWASRPQLLLS